MIFVTTSRHPSARARSLCNDLARVIPNAARINRGRMNSKRLIAFASANRAQTVMLIDSHMGNPSSLSLIPIASSSHVNDTCKLTLLGVQLQREFEKRVKVFSPKRLFVLIEDGEDLEAFGKKICQFFGGEPARTADMKRLSPKRTEPLMILRIEERQREIILRFMSVDPLKDYGPLLRIRKNETTSLHLGGL